MKMKKQMGKRLLAGMMGAATLSVSVTSQLFCQPSLNASAANDNYAKLLQYTLYFYDANMCGSQVGESSALDWRDDCHTGDDADGGFHDAGDHAVFGLPQGFSASTLGWGYYEFKDSYDALGQTAHLKNITDYFCTFFKNSTVLNSNGEVERFCDQKGNGNEDHSYWGPPEKQGNTRPQSWTANGASDIAAEYAAALALNYINFGNEEDLKYAKALYAFSVKHNSITTDTQNCYNSDDCKDDQAWAAGWLYLATNDNSYKNDCASKQAQYFGWTHSWNNVQIGAGCVYAHITGDWSKINSYIGGKCTGTNYFFQNEWGSARYNTAMQLTALAATKNSSADYANWCKGQMDYILGNNPANTNFIIGMEPNSSKNPHHRAASGLEGWDQFNNTDVISPTNGHVLVGALVGGPKDAGGTYTDSIKDYYCNEVTIDYNAAVVGAAAGLYEIYKTGSLETTIPGAKIVYGPDTPIPTEPSTETPTQSPTNDDDPTEVPTEVPTQDPTNSHGNDKKDAEVTSMGENKWQINVAGAKEVIITANVGNIQNAQGCMGYSNGEWQQENWSGDADGNGNIVKQYEVPAGTSTIEFQVWWPNTVNSVTAVLVFEESQEPTEPITEEITQAPTDPPTDPSEIKYGDVDENDEVDICDVINLCKATMGTYSLSEQGRKNADVDRNGTVDTTDASYILQSLIGLVSLPL